MTITNGYCTLADLKAELGVSDTTDDTALGASINAASRQIDGYCGRRFWQDAQTVTRHYYAEDPLNCEVDDISTATGLVVSVDLTGYGAYDISLTLNTDFILKPLNAAFEVPVEPWTELGIVLGSRAYFPAPRQRPGIQVTAKFGWPAIPDAVAKACLIQAAQLFKAKDAPFGIATFGDMGGGLRVSARLNPLAQALLGDFRKAPVG